MGLSPFSRCSSSCCSTPSPTVVVVKEQPRVKLPNPNPKNYKIMEGYQEGDNLVVKINYPDCTNYEGDKVLVYRDTTMRQLMELDEIDPHFCNRAIKSPFARFEPTKDGMDAARKLARII